MKILIIGSSKIDENGAMGGAEKYNIFLINFFIKKNYKIDFLYLSDWGQNGDWKLKENVNYIKIKRERKRDYKMKLPKNKILNVFASCFYICLEQINKNKDEKYLDVFIKKNKSKYFLIICTIPLYLSKKTRNSNNFFFIQHQDHKIYDRFYFYNRLNYGKYSILYKNLLLILNGALLLNKSILRKTKNVVFYSNDKKYSKINKNVLVGSIPIEDEFFKLNFNKYLNKKKSIVYFGRFDNESKNLELLSDIAKKGNFNIDLYGYGDYEMELKKTLCFMLKIKLF